MQGEAYKHMTELCEKIQFEQDQEKFARLLAELNRFLEEKEKLAKLPPTKGPNINPAA